jgi:DNA-binding FadR family transcriptional regulator
MQETPMQTSQAKDFLPLIDQHARNAVQLSQHSDNVPDELRSRLNELEREAARAAAMVTVEQDQQRIIDCVDRLEELGDRALQTCDQADNIDTQVKNAVQTVHGAISDLQRRLH